eukprot:COSAG01_NODE_775_length_13698_cov_60.191632_7_plen_130_part_00
MSTRYIQHKEAILKAFRCQQSGNCCRCPGYVYVTPRDMAKMAAIKQQSITQFKQESVLEKNNWHLIATPDFRPKCFLDKTGKRCTVYEARPKACRTFPDWPSIWDSDAHIKETAAMCPGFRKALSDLKI